MKTIYKIFILVFMAALWACEKNDPLAEQGDFTGNIVPFNLLAQMPDAAAGDTLILRNVTWAVEDDIDKVVFHHSGFKLRNYEVKWSISAEGTTYEMASTFAEDSILFELSQIASYSGEAGGLNPYYQTQENAYVILHEFIVPQQYKLTKENNRDLIDAMESEIFDYFVNTFSVQLNRDILTTIFPSINRFSVVYFVFDNEGFFTGELTPAGIDYFKTNITRERFSDFVKEATVVDNTRVTVRTEANVKGISVVSPSSRIFRVI
jgi:hypothetical protein